MMTRAFSLSLLSACLFTLACGDDRPSQPPEPTQPSVSFAISECGGFGQLSAEQPASTYCDAEVIEWRHDPATSTLKIVNKRVLLNCCGEHSMSAAWEGETLVLKELDVPTEAGGRCRCECTFDFEITIDNIASPLLSVRVEREVVQPDEQKTVIRATLDLGEGNGSLVVDNTNLGSLCDTVQPPPEPEDLTTSFKLSECGGFQSKADTDLSAYCDAEVLTWTYESVSQTLSIDNQRILLNCCGDRSLKVTQDDAGVLTITEGDEAGDAGRCDCMCVFDLQGVATPVTGSQVPFKLVRESFDAGEASVAIVASGTLDLDQGSGSIVVDTTDVGPWCE
ncbi:MAG: hypothetical protein JRH20_02465 [Deltaproteobacteria bacterium]|nr:hypothetical protein [Deltaproteobacteria bacterium]